MPGKRRPPEDRQVAFSWLDPTVVFAAADRRGGSVLFEAAEVSRIIKGREPRLPRVRTTRSAAKEPASMGLPFGPRVAEGRLTCWSCGADLAEGELLRPAPGMLVCPGCGGRLPFAE